jgi:hypothetical protein
MLHGYLPARPRLSPAATLRRHVRDRHPFCPFSDGKRRLRLPNLYRQRRTTQFGHHDVGNQEPDRLAMLVIQRQGFHAAGRFDHGVATAAKRGRQQEPHSVVIIDQKH